MSEAQPLDLLLDHLKRSRGFDFTGYKRTSLARRVHKRMSEVGVSDYLDYRDRLEANTDEFTSLFNTILINVTSFFRDEQPWEYLAQEIIPQLVTGKAETEAIRVWSTGCATGEEAYSVAILLAEQLGENGFRDRVKIYATDVDEDALTIGRHALYPAKAVSTVPEQLRERYFERSDRGYAFRKELRRCVIFGRNDLLQDPPISRIDLLVARNTLMYFTPETQSRILANFFFALADDGFLMLGKSEVLLTRSNLFLPVNLRRRVFRKAPRMSIRDRLLTLVDDSDRPAHERTDPDLRDAAFEAGATAQVVVTSDGAVTLANKQARQMFGLSTKDLGRQLGELELSYRPVELRSLIEQAQTEGHPISVRDVHYGDDGAGNSRLFDLQVLPLATITGETIGTTVTFVDVTRYNRLTETLERSKHELETAYEELQATAEELETTNEELQSTNEELETTNEELQSTNEELETMNEELQSTNEELETMNDELRRSSDDLNEINAFLESILMSLHGGVVVVDAKLRVLAWNGNSTELWGLRADEVEGEHFLDLDIGLPVGELRGAIRSVLAGERQHATTVLEATNRRGRPITVSVTCTPLFGQSSDVRGAILVVEERQSAQS
jgi:two-component system CheB/CheR fusion protein